MEGREVAGTTKDRVLGFVGERDYIHEVSAGAARR